MGIITEVSVQKKNKSRVNVYVDGEFVCGLEAFVALGSGLKQGREIDETELGAIQLKSDGEAAFKKAVGYLGVRMRTKNEIIRYLKGKDYSNIVIADVINKLQKYGYIDDAALVSEYVRCAGGSRSNRRIKAGLMRMGAGEELIDESLDNCDEGGAAANAAKKYVRTHRNFDKNKLAAYLQMNGFGWDSIRKVLNDLLVEGDAADD